LLIFFLFTKDWCETTDDEINVATKQSELNYKRKSTNYYIKYKPKGVKITKRCRA